MKPNLLVLALVIAALACLGSVRSADQPNILFLLSDDQSWNGLSCQMHPDIPGSAHRYIETPNIARLASEGRRFSAAYSPAPVCSPTRISLQTGKSPAQLNWTKAAPTMTAEDGFRLISPTINKRIPEEEVTIGEILQRAGYATALYGKWHLAGGGPESHGYHESDGETGNQDAAPFVEPNPVDIFGMGERAAAFMEKSKEAGKPFFITCYYHALHYPQNATKALVEKYNELIPGGNEKEIGRAAISEDLDRGIGLLLERLEELGLKDNTYVIYMSDNGGGVRGVMKGGKGDVWEAGIRVPLIVRGPGIEANSWCHERVVGYDFFNTFCELGQVTERLPADVEGGSITHLLHGETGPVMRPFEELVFHFPHYQGDSPHTALYLGDYKLIRHYEDGALNLFNITEDIGESRNLATQMPERASQMEGLMDAYLETVGAQFPTPNPNYDPANPPDIRKGNADKKGGGGGKGSKGGKGGKKPRK
ncbi:MAG: sulfatase-like hydrolase/transferase [Verrucomicrobiales bacterium]